MGRPVQMRVSYFSDAGYLLRLQSALMKDERQSPEWRESAAAKANALARILLEADARVSEQRKQETEPRKSAKK